MEKNQMAAQVLSSQKGRENRGILVCKLGPYITPTHDKRDNVDTD